MCHIKEQIWQNRERILVCLVFALFLLYGLMTFRDYGLPYDDPIERTTGLSNYKYVFLDENVEQIGDVNFSEIPDLSTSVNRYYGVVAQYIPILIESIFGFTLDTHKVYMIRHLFTFLVFWMACLFFYCINRDLKRTRMESLLFSIALILSPRILADSFYNIKDLVFLSAVIVNLWAGLKFIERPGLCRGLILSVISAICINVRIVGGEIIFLCLVVALVMGVRRKQYKTTISWTLLTAVFSFCIYILITPVTWNDIVGSIFETLSTFSNYSGWNGYNYYLGEALSGSELPWHYLIIWILATTPVAYILLFGIGTVGYGAKSFRLKKISPSAIVIGLYVIIPVLYAVIMRPVLYNGWRHFYFIYPGILLIAGSGWNSICNWLKKRQLHIGKITGANILSIVSCVYLCCIALWIAQNHPYEYVYFNTLSRDFASKNLERDYWQISRYDALLWISENDNSDLITVSGVPDDLIEYLPNEELRHRFKVVDESPMYLIYNKTTEDPNERFDGDYISELKGESWFAFDGFDLYDDIYDITVDGMSICSVYQRNYNKTQGSMFRIDNESVLCEYDNVIWTNWKDDNYLYLEGCFEGVYWTDRIGLQCSTDLLPEFVQITEDGETWITYTVADWAQREEKRLQINEDGSLIAAIRLIFPLEKIMSNEEEQIFSLGFYCRTADPVDWKNHGNGIFYAEMSTNPQEMSFAIDGYISTRWSSGVPQSGGITCLAELKEVARVGGITIDYGIYENDYPRGLIIEGSLDGNTWYNMNAYTEDGRYYWLDEMNVKFIRITLTDESEWNWSICELLAWITPN